MHIDLHVVSIVYPFFLNYSLPPSLVLITIVFLPPDIDQVDAMMR